MTLGNMGNIKFVHVLCILLSLSFKWCTSTNELNGDSFPVYKSDNFNGLQQERREPISENSTLAKALALARQFLVRDENIVTSINVELFKRSDGSQVVTTTKKPKMYSWWTFTKKPTTTTTTEEPPAEEEEEGELEQETTEVPVSERTELSSTTMQHPQFETTPILEDILTTVPITSTIITDQSNINDNSAKTETPMTPDSVTVIANIPEIPITITTPVMQQTLNVPTTTPVMQQISDVPTSVTVSTPKPNKKPRPTKRPQKEKRTTAMSTPSLPDVTTILPSNDQEQGQTTTKSLNSITDPFGVKRTLAEIVSSFGKTVLNQTKSVAVSTAEKVVPVARDTARQVGIIALTAAGQVGTLGKTVAENAYGNLAKRLNATELLDNKKNVNVSPTPRITQAPQSDQMNLGIYDDEESGASVHDCKITVILGTVGLLVLKYVIT